MATPPKQDPAPIVELALSYAGIVVQDGLLTAGRLVDLLRADGRRIGAVVLHARVDQAVLRRTAPDASGRSVTAALPPPETPLAATPETPEADAAATSEAGASGVAASVRRMHHRYRRFNGSGSVPSHPRRAGPMPSWWPSFADLGGPASGDRDAAWASVGSTPSDWSGWPDGQPARLHLSRATATDRRHAVHESQRSR